MSFSSSSRSFPHTVTIADHGHIDELHNEIQDKNVAANINCLMKILKEMYGQNNVPSVTFNSESMAYRFKRNNFERMLTKVQFFKFLNAVKFVKSSSDGEEGTCSICLANLSNIILICCHVLCYDCFKKLNNHTCPFCAVVTEEKKLVHMVRNFSLIEDVVCTFAQQ